MKKIITVLTIAFSLFLSSCSKNDEVDPNQELPLTYQNMAGEWYLTSIIKEDGVVQPFPLRCPETRDYAKINANGRITTYIHYADCTPGLETCNFYYFEGNRIKNCQEVFNEARVTSLTATTMRIEYDIPRTFGAIVGDGAKVLLLTK